MTRDSYKRALVEARNDLARAIADRDELTAKIVQLKQTIRSLAELCDEDPELVEQWVAFDEGNRPSGITAAVRAALQWAKSMNHNPMTVLELQLLMGNRGFDFSKQANPQASLMTIVRRLKDNGEVEEFTRDDGKRAYAWNIEKENEAERARRARLKFGPPQF